MGQALPKQYLQLHGRSVLGWTILACLATDAVDRVTVVIHPDDEALYRKAVDQIDDARLTDPVHGGETRARSVSLGLQAMAIEPPDRVLIHDAARPFVSPELIASVNNALAVADGAFAAIPVVDALWVTRDGFADAPMSREELWRAQTPQGFHFQKILAAHLACNDGATDDVAVARLAGLDVRVVEGSEQNFKITTADDMLRAERLIANRK